MDQLRNGTPNLSTSSSSTCSVRNLIEAVAKIRHQKQCATVVRIHKAVRQQLQRNIDVEEVIQQLALATNSGALWRVDNNGVTSYREPPKGSSKEQVRWSQKESARWPNKDSQVRSSGNNHSKYSLQDHVSYNVPDNNMFQQMADQFSWSEARRWTESVTPWNMPEPVRQHLGDPLAWPMNEPLKRPINDSIPWTSPDQYRIAVQESFPWPMPTEPFAWPVAEPWRQTMIEQFKRAEGSGNFVFENMNYRSLMDSSHKGLMGDPNQWPVSDDSTKQQKCSLPKDTFHPPRDPIGSMNAAQNSSMGPENIHSIDKQHKSALGVCMVNQSFPDASDKNVELECNSSWYVNKDQIMSFPVQERKEYNSSCASPNNYLTQTFASQNPNSLQNSSTDQHISSHFYEQNDVPRANEVFSNGLQVGDNSLSYGHTYLENNPIYCDDRAYKPIVTENTNKSHYHEEFGAVAWPNYAETDGQLQPSKVCFNDKNEAFISDESNKSNEEVENPTKNGTECDTRSDFIPHIDMPAESSCNSPLLSEKPPDLTIFPKNIQEDNKCSDQNAMEDSSPPILGEPLVEMQVNNSTKEKKDVVNEEHESHDDKNSDDCRESCDKPIGIETSRLKNEEGLSGLNDSVFKPSMSPNRLKSREAPLPILEKLTQQSLKSGMSLITQEEISLNSETKRQGAQGYLSSDTNSQSCIIESVGNKRKMNIFDTITPSAKCSKVSEGKINSTSPGRDRKADDFGDEIKASLHRNSVLSLHPPTDIHLRGLVDGLTRFFTPTNKRPSRVSQNAVQRNASLILPCPTAALTRLRKPPTSPSSAKIKKILTKPTINKTISNAPSPSAVASSMPARKPRREQLIDGLSHFFSAQGKRRTRVNKCPYDGDLGPARSQSSSTRDNAALDVIPRVRASSANSPSSCVTPLGCSTRWSSENLGCRESSLNLHLSPSMISRLKSTKWLSSTRKQPQSLMLKLNADSSVTSLTNGEAPADVSPIPLCSPKNSPFVNVIKSEDKNNANSKSNINSMRVVDEHAGNPSKLHLAKPTSDDSSMFRKARDVFMKKCTDSEATNSLANLSSIQFGEFKIEVSYLSNFPIEFSSLPVLYFCEFCLKYFKSSSPLQKHLNTCMCRRPPGNEIYRFSSNYSIYEVEACTSIMYCEHLCSLSRLFVEPELQMLFSSPSHLFYILTKNDQHGSHLMGFFVRDRHQEKGPCLVFLFVLPPYRRKGYATFLINFSYQLCKLLNVPGFLKRMFSVPVLSAFQQYWSWATLDYLQNCWDHKQPLTIKYLSVILGISSANLTSTLLKLGIIQTRIRSKHVFNPNIRAIESNAKDFLKKEKSFLRINLKNVCIENSVLLKNRLTVDQLMSIRGATSDEEDDHMDNDDSGISLHCGSCGESQQESINSVMVSEAVIPSDEKVQTIEPSTSQNLDKKLQPAGDYLIPSTHSENFSGLPSVPPNISWEDDVCSKSVPPTSSLPLVSVVKKESRSVEVQTDAYESEYSSDDYDDEDDEGEEDEDNEIGNNCLGGTSISQYNAKGGDDLHETQKVVTDEKSNSRDVVKTFNEIVMPFSQDSSVTDDKVDNKSLLHSLHVHDSNNNMDKKEQSAKKFTSDTNNQINKFQENACSEEQSNHTTLDFKENNVKNSSLPENDAPNDELGSRRNSNKKACLQIKHQEQTVHSSDVESSSYVSQLPSPSNSDMRSPSSVSSYSMSNQPPGKLSELNSDKTNSSEQNIFPSGNGYQDKAGLNQSSNKFSNECYLTSDAINVPITSSPAVYTGLYFNNPLNPLFINQNSPGSINCNHYNMPTPSPTNSSSRSFGMASPNSNNFQTPQNNPQILDRGCPSAPMLTYGRVSCPQPSNDGQFPWTPIYHSQPAPTSYSFIKFSDQEIVPCGIAPFPSMTSLPESFTNAITLGPTSKGLSTGTSQNPKPSSNRKCSSKACKSSTSISQCSSFRNHHSVAPNVTLQPGTNVITNYNVLNMNVAPEYRNHQPITYPSPPYITAANPTFIGQTAKQHINIYQHQAIGFPQQPQHHNGMYAAATYSYLNGAIAPQSFSINVNNVMK